MTISFNCAPARARNSKSPNSLMIGSVIPRGSCQAKPGASGVPASSIKTPVSLNPVKPIAITFPPANSAAFDATEITVLASSNISISLQFFICFQGVGSAYSDKTFRFRSVATALRRDVPMSTPIRISCIIYSATRANSASGGRQIIAFAPVKE